MPELTEAMLCWRTAAMALAEAELEELGTCDPRRADVTELLADIQEDEGLAREYTGWILHHPELAAAMVAAGNSAKTRAMQSRSEACS